MTRLHRLGGALLLAAIASGAAGGVASASYGPPVDAPAYPAFSVPLTGSVAAGGGTWATVVMGKNDGNADLFWQLFSLDATTGRFSLITPPGVADNGGLMLAPTGAGGAALVGFGASQDLTFSPLASTTDGGRDWNPGGLPTALVDAPSVLAASDSASVALVGSSSERVVERSGALTDWRTLATTKAVAATPAGKTCVASKFEALALDPSGAPLLGATCREPDTPGVFVDSDEQWHLADIPVPTALERDAFATLRLGSSSALLAGVKGNSVELVAAWEPASDRPWIMSAPLPIGALTDLVATGDGPGSSQFVMIRTSAGLRAEVISGPTGSWTALPKLPAGTATIAIAPDGTRYALTVKVAKLGVWRLSAGASWAATQTITVPIPYGTSS